MGQDDKVQWEPKTPEMSNSHEEIATVDIAVKKELLVIWQWQSEKYIEILKIIWKVKSSVKGKTQWLNFPIKIFSLKQC